MEHQLLTEDWEAELGRRLRGLRLRQNVDQRTLAARAGVALNVVKHLETGKGSTLASLVKVLRALGRDQGIASRTVSSVHAASRSSRSAISAPYAST